MSATVLLAMAGRARADMSVVADGKSDYVIVVGQDASPSEKFAAEELAAHVKMISGAELPVRAQGGALPARAIVLGFGPEAETLGVKADASLGAEGYIIRTLGDRLLVAGGRQRGTLYGVYTLLESLGVRWWTPQETFVPKQPKIELPPMDIRDVPRLEYREVMYGEIWSDAGRLWCARNKVNGMGGDAAPEKLGGHYFVAGLHGHNTVDLVEDAVGKGNLKPEMWALAKGRDGTLRRVTSEICPSNPEVIAATLKSLLKIYRAHPDSHYLIVAHEDHNDYCRCPTCAALCEHEGTPAAQNIQFVNTLAAALEKEIPGAGIRTDAYLWTRKPPKNLRPRDNVIVSFAPIEADYAHPLAAASNEENRRIKEDIEGWSRIAPKLFIWNYVGNRAHYLMPEPDFDSMVPDVKFFADNKAVGIGEQGTHVGVGTEFVSLRMWVLARALWKPETADNKLIAEFLTGFYGPAAPALQKYIDIMHRYGREHDYHLGRFTRMSVPFLQPRILAEAEVALREADKAAAGDPVLERRVRQAHLPLWYILAKRGPESETWKAVEAKVGKLDFARIAELSNQTAKEWSIYAVADPEESAPWFEWLTDYATLLQKQSPVLPPELKAYDLKTCRLIQARQIDSSYLERKGQWQKMDGASDGWVLKVIKPGWMVQHTFSRYDEYTVGRKYTLSLRVRGGEKKGDGVGLVAGLFGGKAKLPTREIPAGELSDGAFHVVELGPFEAGPELSLYLAISRDGSMPEVYFDCMWLREVK